MCILVCNLVKASLFPVQEVAELQQLFQSSEREKEIVRQQPTGKEAELTGAEETIRREQQVRCVIMYNVKRLYPCPQFIVVVWVLVCTKVEVYMPVQVSE